MGHASLIKIMKLENKFKIKFEFDKPLFPPPKKERKRRPNPKSF